ncbi:MULTISPECIES: hypothetical protein [Dactylosporangium]|uniref:Uncharacterized protein n=2 Tax=Dactylosporangium TaxID=35753 RepID=A0A9W6KR02_9ACTN|nr:MULTISPECIES: hypothetical protein [Dactylosporangium]UAB94978.1 hypothetical protein Dvina_44060 [Dactylosporangium vinaceum]UWZ43345.1 hypothetical protein Dmats_38655 [Dactylosporangium matsuzakiense]GLL05059.1 hypothetical protein GCM10017581_068060 [Dactylosporangium matsuzakiense]
MKQLQQLDQRLLPPVGNVLARIFRGAQRLRVFTVVVGVVAVTATLLAVHRNERPRSDPSLGDVLRVGVAEGASIPGYIQAGKDELGALPGDAPVYALVSFTAYLGPERLTPVLADVSVSSVFARVPLPGTQTELVRLGAYRLPDDVILAMDETAQRKTEEAQHYRDLLGRNDGIPDDNRQLYLSGSIVADQEATAYREHCSCVYAAVVYASPVALRAVAARPETRVVDPITELQRLDRTVFMPPLPEQTTVAEPVSEGAGTVVASPEPS